MPRQRRVFLFTFGEEEANRRRASAEHEDLLLLLARINTSINAGWAFLPGLPGFERRDKHTLQVALLVRSFKSLSSALDLAVRGYYVQAATLLRSLYENELIIWASEVDPKAVEWLWEQDWPGEETFMKLARRMDAWLLERDLTPRMVETWEKEGTYGTLSEIAHPRGRGLEMEFDASGRTLNTGPQWDGDHLMFALGVSLSVGVRLILLQHYFLGRLGQLSQQWLDMVAATISDVEAWLDSNPLDEGACA